MSPLLEMGAKALVTAMGVSQRAQCRQNQELIHHLRHQRTKECQKENSSGLHLENGQVAAVCGAGLM